MPEPSRPSATDELTLRVAGPADLPRLGADMANCLASYGRGRTADGDRIVEVRRAGRTVYAVHVRAGRVVTFEAAGNRPPDAADVPVVHDLLRRSGLLDRTQQESSAREAARRPSPPRTRRPRTDRPDRTDPPPRRPPPPPPGVSVQQLAAELLAPPRLGGTEWPELAAALWATGALPRLPDPGEEVWEQVVRDLATRVALGDDSGLRPVPAPSAEQRAAAARHLRSGPPPRTVAAQQRHRMADVLEGDVRP